MKKLFLTAIIALLFCSAAAVQAQDCDAIAGPFLQLRGINKADYPADKFDYRCQFSRNTFYFCDEVPEGATVFTLDQLTDRITGEKVSANMVIDLNTLSYYRYDWVLFQNQDMMHHVYFRLRGNNSHPYLGLRTDSEAMRMVVYHND